MINRNSTADLLKGIALLLMIQVHILELFATENIFNCFIGKVFLFLGGPPVAPLFLTIFGYFIISSKKSANQLLLRGLKIFVLGMFLNVGLNLHLIISVSRGIYDLNIWQFVFGVDILPFAGFAIFTIALIKPIIERHLFVTLSCIIVVVLLGGFLQNYIPQNTTLQYVSAFFYGGVKWSYFPLFPWLGYPLTGIAFYQFQQKINLSFLATAKSKLITSIIFIVFIIFTITYAINVSSNLQNYYHHSFLFFTWVILFLGFYVFILNDINTSLKSNYVTNYLKWLGKNVTLVYVIQWLIIGNMATDIYRTISSPFVLIISVLGITVITSALCYFILKTFGKKITTS